MDVYLSSVYATTVALFVLCYMEINNKDEGDNQQRQVFRYFFSFKLACEG